MSDIPEVIDPANVQNYPRKYIDEICRLRQEVARLAAQLTAVTTLRDMWRDAAEDRTKQLAPLAATRRQLAAAAQGLIEYRDRAGAINFQLEKADDYIRMLRAALRNPPAWPPNTRCTCDLSDTPDAPADWHFENCPEYKPSARAGAQSVMSAPTAA